MIWWIEPLYVPIKYRLDARLQTKSTFILSLPGNGIIYRVIDEDENWIHSSVRSSPGKYKTILLWLRLRALRFESLRANIVVWFLVGSFELGSAMFVWALCRHYLGVSSCGVVVALQEQAPKQIGLNLSHGKFHITTVETKCGISPSCEKASESSSTYQLKSIVWVT